MAGWLAVWSFSNAPPQEQRWTSSVRQAERHGNPVNQTLGVGGGGASLAAWRRSSGEFPASGRIHRPEEGVHIAWVGQCLEDEGDKSTEAMNTLTRAPADTDAGLERLNGPFSAAIVEENPRRMTIVLDRHRHMPVYVAKSSDHLVAGTDLRTLMPWLDRPALRPGAVDLLLRCGELINDMVLLDGVEMLPSAAVMRIGENNTSTTRYWTLRHEPDTGLSFESLAEELGRRLRIAVRRVERTSDNVGITLSGGLDSRFLLGLCEHPSRVPSFTWGLPGCRDVICATNLAKRMGSPHVIRHWSPEAFPPRWDEGVEATAGSIGVDGMYMLPFAGLLGEHCNVILNGLAGDALLGGNFLRPSWLRERSHSRLAEASWRWRVRAEEDELIDAISTAPAGSRGRDLWIESIKRERREQPILRLNDWLYENRVFRTTNCGTMLLRRCVESHAPFFDRDFLDLLLQAPLEMRLRHRLYLATMKRTCRDAGRSPWQRTGLPPAWGYFMNVASMGYHKGWRRLMKIVGHEAFPRLKVADPADWMRGPWRTEIERIILSDRALERGCVNPDGVREAWRHHLAGEDHTKTIGALVAVELFAQRMIDPPPSTATVNHT